MGLYPEGANSGGFFRRGLSERVMSEGVMSGGGCDLDSTFSVIIFGELSIK